MLKILLKWQLIMKGIHLKYPQEHSGQRKTKIKKFTVHSHMLTTEYQRISNLI